MIFKPLGVDAFRGSGLVSKKKHRIGMPLLPNQISIMLQLLREMSKRDISNGI